EDAQYEAEQEAGVTVSPSHQLFCSFPASDALLGGRWRMRVCTMARVPAAAPATLMMGATTLSLTNVAVPLTVFSVSSAFSSAGAMRSLIRNAIAAMAAVIAIKRMAPTHMN